MPIDMHAHWVPQRLVEASATGKNWYGWRLLYDRSGQEHVSLGDRIARLKVSGGTLADPAARAAARESDEVLFEALILLGLFWNYHLEENRGGELLPRVE